MNKQLTFSLISDEPTQAKTSKKEFLEKIERIIPFDKWIEIICRAFSDFCGVDSPNQIPDGNTIGRFRNILVENGLQEKHSYFITIKAQSKSLFENPFLPVFAVDSLNSDKSRLRKSLS